MKSWKLLAGCIALAFLPSLSGIVSKPDEWYRGLEKPPGNPPAWVFAPVWTTLYLMMGVAHYLFTTAQSDKPKSVGHTLYLSQLLLNGTWTLVFFGAKAPCAALANIVMLWAIIFGTMREFDPKSPRAARLLLPYLLWVSFATYLNFEICRRNKG